jgi:hypothetical protein
LFSPEKVFSLMEAGFGGLVNQKIGLFADTTLVGMQGYRVVAI